MIDQHQEHLDNSSVKNLFSGSWVDDDRDIMIGSLIIVDAAIPKEIDELTAGEPMNKSELYERLNITRCNQRKGSFVDMVN